MDFSDTVILPESLTLNGGGPVSMDSVPFGVELLRATLAGGA